MLSPLDRGTWKVTNGSGEDVGMVFIDSPDGKHDVQRWLLRRSFRSPPFDRITISRHEHQFGSIREWREALGNGLWTIASKYIWVCGVTGREEQVNFDAILPVEVPVDDSPAISDPEQRWQTIGYVHSEQPKGEMPALSPPKGDVLFTRLETWYLPRSLTADGQGIAFRMGPFGPGTRVPAVNELPRAFATVLCYNYVSPPFEGDFAPVGNR